MSKRNDRESIRQRALRVIDYVDRVTQDYSENIKATRTYFKVVLTRMTKTGYEVRHSELDILEVMELAVEDVIEKELLG